MPSCIHWSVQKLQEQKSQSTQSLSNYHATYHQLSIDQSTEWLYLTSRSSSLSILWFFSTLFLLIYVNFCSEGKKINGNCRFVFCRCQLDSKVDVVKIARATRKSSSSHQRGALFPLSEGRRSSWENSSLFPLKTWAHDESDALFYEGKEQCKWETQTKRCWVMKLDVMLGEIARPSRSRGRRGERNMRNKVLATWAFPSFSYSLFFRVVKGRACVSPVSLPFLVN